MLNNVLSTLYTGLTSFAAVSLFIIPSSSVVGTTPAKAHIQYVQVEETKPLQYKICKSFYESIGELGDLISKGEGDWNSVNRGWAGDTPGGITRLTGKSFSEYSIKEVMQFQRSWLFAVGRYQFIPSTLRFAVSASGISTSEMFTPQTQQRLFATLLDQKRPAVGTYIRGHHNNLSYALDELAKEWASVEYRSGRGYYDHVGNNRAHITRVDAAAAINAARVAYCNK